MPKQTAYFSFAIMSVARIKCYNIHAPSAIYGGFLFEWELSEYVFTKIPGQYIELLTIPRIVRIREVGHDIERFGNQPSQRVFIALNGRGLLRSDTIYHASRHLQSIAFQKCECQQSVIDRPESIACDY